MTAAGHARRQRGAALVIVLLLVATLSFVVLAISERTVMAASRSVNMQTRSSLLWAGFGAEVLAGEAIELALAVRDKTLADDSPLFQGPAELPFEQGAAVVAFADRTRCFNVNSLVAGEDGALAANPDAVEEFKTLFRETDTGVNVDAVAEAIVDWIDSDSFQEPRGAEDGRYAGMPAPYRSGGTLLADISETRAIEHVDPAVYAVLASRACALPQTEPPPINVNLLGPDDAPLLVALTAGAVSTEEARDVIAARPPGGYASVEAFWGADAFAGKDIPEAVKSRAALSSQFIEAYAVIGLGQAGVNVRMLFEVGEGARVRLVSRRIERFE